MSDDLPTFAEVAALIAKGAPTPEWLVPALEHFSKFIGTETVSSAEEKQLREFFVRMGRAADFLIKGLPALKETALLIVPHTTIDMTIASLLQVKKSLAHVIPPSRAEPNVQRRFCAAVVIEAWRIVHGEAKPEGPKLWQACNEYWQACGHAYEGGDIDAWRRDCRQVTEDYAGIGHWLEEFRNQI